MEPIDCWIVLRSHDANTGELVRLGCTETWAKGDYVYGKSLDGMIYQVPVINVAYFIKHDQKEGN